MNPRQLESWALNVIELVKSGKSNEDDLVEFKRLVQLEKDLPEVNKKDKLADIARRIAGHSNAARGEDILWLIGIDQKSETNKIPGFDNNIDLANWYPSVEKHFIEQFTPRLTAVNIPIDDKIILALGFETDRSPFVVKNQKDPNFNEFPWREGTRVRSARRSDLILLLSPIEKLPDVEIVASKIYLQKLNQKSQEIKLNLYLDLFIIPQSETIFSIPFRRCTIKLNFSTIKTAFTFNSVVIQPKSSKNSKLESSPYQIRIKGSGMTVLIASMTLSILDYAENDEIQIEAKLFTTISDRPIVLTTHVLPFQIHHKLDKEFKVIKSTWLQ